MSRIRLTARRHAVRLREERYFRLWHRYARKGRKLKGATPEKARNRRRRTWYAAHYLAARKNRKALDRKLARLPITQVDQAGIAFITGEEGVRLQPYDDSRGLATIGVGHLLHMSAVTNADRSKYAHFDRHDADVLLARDLDGFEKVVAASFAAKGALKATHNRFNAMTSLAFNIGAGGYETSTAARGVRTGSVTMAVEGILMWDKPPELLGRREREAALFKKA